MQLKFMLPKLQSIFQNILRLMFYKRIHYKLTSWLGNTSKGQKRKKKQKNEQAHKIYFVRYLPSYVYISSVQIKLEFFLTGFICMLIYPTDGTDQSCSFQILQEALLKHLTDTQNSERN